MSEVKVLIASKDTFVGAMARALANQVGGHQAVRNATDGRLQIYGFLTFHFQSEYHAQEFRNTVSKYLGTHGAVAE